MYKPIVVCVWQIIDNQLYALFPLSYFVRQKFSNVLNTTQILKRGIFLSFPCLIE